MRSPVSSLGVDHKLHPALVPVSSSIAHATYLSIRQAPYVMRVLGCKALNGGLYAYMNQSSMART